MQDQHTPSARGGVSPTGQGGRTDGLPCSRRKAQGRRGRGVRGPTPCGTAMRVGGVFAEAPHGTPCCLLKFLPVARPLMYPEGLPSPASLSCGPCAHTFAPESGERKRGGHERSFRTDRAWTTWRRETGLQKAGWAPAGVGWRPGPGSPVDRCDRVPLAMAKPGGGSRVRRPGCGDGVQVRTELTVGVPGSWLFLQWSLIS